MATIEEKYEFTTARESILSKDWAAGSSKIIESTEYVISLNNQPGGNRYRAEYKKVRYAPAWLKIIDEPIVNALDHRERCDGTSTPVTWIKVGFDSTGRVRVSNNGPGLEIAVHKIASEKLGRETFVPEFVFGELFQGSNRTKAEDSIIGGTNGLGAKLSNCFSDEFIVETVDATRKLFYLQRWRNKMLDREPRRILSTDDASLPLERRLPHTTLSFLPSYTHFGYDSFTPEVYRELVDVVRTRVIFAAAYAKFAAANGANPRARVDVYFNDELLDIGGMDDVAAILFPKAPRVRTLIKPETKAGTRAPYRYTWEVVAVILGSNDEETGSAVNQLSNVNGVVVREGKHTKHLFTKVIDGVKEKIMKLFKDKNMTFKSSYVTNNMFLLANTQIPNPGWTGQRKDVVDLDIRKLSGYTFDKTFIDTVTNKLRDQITDEVMNENEKASAKKKTDADVEYDKYKPARKSESRSAATRAKCCLLATEGDSAMTQTCTGVANNPNMGFDYYGVISLGGVILNARKECTVIETLGGGRRIKKSKKLMENKFLNALCAVTGLNLSHKYDPDSPTYKKEMSELKYGCIVACVDQDYDGVGNIFGLLLNIFELFWHHLITAGFVKRFDTPKIRAYPKAGGKIAEFYNDEEYKRWVGDLENAGRSTDAWKIKYYKGLGTHSRDETIHMFKNFQQHLYTYYLDQNSHKHFEVYYGVDPDLRKVALAQPAVVPTPDKIQHQISTMHISCSDHLEYETKTFQKDSIERHLDHALDGFNQSGRMIFDGSQKAFRGSNKEMKVAQLAGYISEHEKYHHGEMSLADSITGRAFITVGGKQIPQLLPYGQFGSRLKGGKDAAQSRYIWTKLNKPAMDAIYPEDDYWLLDFTFDEGERGAPKYYLPIVPTAILESTELPGHGWKIKTWGRDVLKVIDNVRRLIRMTDNTPLLAMPAYTHGWKGKIQTIRGEPYSFGVYEYDEVTNSVHITELPLRVWTDDYVEKLRKKATPDGRVIDNIIDSSDDRTVNIEIMLKPDAMEWLQSNGWGDAAFTDPIEEYFQLRDHMDSNLNMIGARGEVCEFKTYEEVLRYWFPYRRDMYAKRIDRKRIILKLKIKYYENLIRYVNECLELRIVKMKVAEMEKKLAESTPPYERMHRAKLFQPKFTPNEKLEEVILRGPKANYDYLLDLTDRKKSEESLNKFNEDLNAIRTELEELEILASRGRFPGAFIWEQELDELVKVVQKGRTTDWMGDDKNKYKFE